MKIMSEDTAADTSSSCASCGIAEVDELKLTECTDCDLVKYCSDACRRDHKSHHLRACKKRSAELHDELLFKQPESSHFGDCPICILPMPLDVKKSSMTACCSKRICDGCVYTNQKREFEERLGRKCPFCRQPVPTEEESEKYRMSMKRVEANDPVALCQKGFEQYRKGDYCSAFNYHSRAAELGDMEAHYQLAILYHFGEGVEKDEKKRLYHLEEAAIGGHPGARHKFGCLEGMNGRTERAAKHLIIAASMGHDGSIKFLLDSCRSGGISKDDLAAALRAHKAAVDATKSPQREAAEEYYRILRDTIDAEDSN